MNTVVLGLLGLPGLLLLAGIYIHTRHRERAFAADLERFPALRGLRRTAGLARAAGVGAGLVAALVMLWLDATGRLVAIAPMVAGVLLVAGVLVGQGLARGAARVPGRASLERRGMRDYLPRGLTIAVGVALVLLAALLAWTTANASATDDGHMRGYAYECTVDLGGEQMVSTHLRSPFPGSYYSGWIALGAVALVVVASVALWVVATRPRNGSDPHLVRLDDALRHQASEGVMAAVGLAMGITWAAVGALTALPAVSALCDGNPSPPWIGLVLGALGAVLGWALALWSLVHLFRPTTGLRR